MFLYLFLVAALAASSEVPTTDPELQEIIALFTEETTENTSLASASASSFAETIADKPEQQKSIIITNAIEPNMLSYKHWTGTYNPDIFTVTVNGVEVAQGAQHTVLATRDPIEIRYDYSFVNGKRTGAKVVSYQLNENVETAKITFSWLDDWRVLVDNGAPVKQEEVVVS